MRTEFTIEGADCPTCLNDTVERLRQVPGVERADASSADGCLVVEHGDLPVESLVDRIHEHLHGTALASNEVVMTEVTPVVRLLGCRH